MRNSMIIPCALQIIDTTIIVVLHKFKIPIAMSYEFITFIIPCSFSYLFGQGQLK